MASQGNKLVFGTTFGYMEPMLKGGRRVQGREVRACHRLQERENMRAYDDAPTGGAYVAGIVAGKMTKTNTTGFVASIPIPEVIRNINAFTLGAQVSTRRSRPRWCGSTNWFDPNRKGPKRRPR